ncbi:VOC family protein [Kroppenstedtia eburnea]|uniref:PhnB protein n=1 Tax=Kroppenstedtia eburnea TaxID=714067 RepID=A0A1N7LCI6_9BACL|nr:VOC family protein [Kroppenstedtia eburnea]QKI81412.1 VOC family protein [Kroppenstedtia eburnea]SIS71544.1 PhnB protein [Kroppenstedtia eburnea]
MAVDVYINFNGNCREAVEFYAEVFGTERPKIMTYGDVPPNPEHSMPEGSEDLVMHARLNIRGSNFMFSDVPPGMRFVAGNNISLSISSRDLDEVKSLFHKLKEGGTVGMELQETFWSKCYGNLTDKFGIEWQVNYESDDIKM